MENLDDDQEEFLRKVNKFFNEEMERLRGRNKLGRQYNYFYRIKKGIAEHFNITSEIDRELKGPTDLS